MILTRVYPLIRFLEIVNDQEITFIRPKLWNDPWECFFVNKKIKTDHGGYSQVRLHDRIFALSLSQHQEETDYGWAAYSPRNDGVLILLDAEPFIEMLGTQLSNKAAITNKPVEYYNEQRIVDLHNEYYSNYKLFTMPDGFDIQIESLFIKRDFFSHEKEYRIIILFRKHGISKSMLKIPLEVNKFIKEIVLDPKTDPSKIKVIESVLKKIGFRNPIKVSKISNPPDFYFRK